MNRLLAFLCIAVLASHLFSSASASVVAVQTGQLSGIPSRKADVEQFLGVPFAAPPVGSLRWAPPTAPAAWSGIRMANAFASKCPQNGWTAPIQAYRNEDCLYLNIYRPRAVSRQRRLPVVLWLHGGSYVAGASQDIDGAVFASRQKIILITANYRIGVFGFAALPQLRSGDAPIGNYGILDQVAALRWVKANIAAFGGDPRRVTLMGQSAGATSAWILLGMPQAHGLFDQMISQSNGGLDPMRTLQEEVSAGPSSKLVAALGCHDAADVALCLRAAPTDQVYEAGGGAATRARGWHPIIDGQTITAQSNDIFASGNFPAIPSVMGDTAREAGFFLQARLAAGGAPWSVADYNAYLAKLNNSAVVDAFAPAHFSSPDTAYVAAETARTLCADLRLAAVVEHQTAVHFYQFADPAAPATIYRPPGLLQGPFHTTDIPYVFDSVYPAEQQPSSPKFAPAQRILSRQMQDAFGNFVRDGRWVPVSGTEVRIFSTSHPTSVQRTALFDSYQCHAF